MSLLTIEPDDVGALLPVTVYVPSGSSIAEPVSILYLTPLAFVSFSDIVDGSCPIIQDVMPSASTALQQGSTYPLNRC